MTRRRAMTLIEVIVCAGLMFVLLTVVLSLLGMARSSFVRTAGEAQDQHKVQVVLTRLASELQDARQRMIKKAPTDSTQPIQVLYFPSAWDNGAVHTDENARLVYCKLVLYYVNPKLQPGKLYRREWRSPKPDYNYRSTPDHRLALSLCDGTGALLVSGVDTIYYQETSNTVDVRLGYLVGRKAHYYNVGRHLFVWN